MHILPAPWLWLWYVVHRNQMMIRLPSEMPTSELPTSRQIWGRHYNNNPSSEMPTLVILLYFQMWMHGSSSIWLGGGQKLFSTNQESNEIKVFRPNIFSTQCWISNLANPLFLIKVNCTLNKKVATELVKELSKICSFTYVFQKKNIVTTALEKN